MFIHHLLDICSGHKYVLRNVLSAWEKLLNRPKISKLIRLPQWQGKRANKQKQDKFIIMLEDEKFYKKEKKKNRRV
jgi:hypothetical protein